MSGEDLYVPKRARPAWRGAILLAGLAFVLGIAATALFIRQYRQWLPKSAQAMIDSPADSRGDGGAGFVPPPEPGDIARAIDNQALDSRQAALAAQLAVLETRTVMIDRDSRLAAANAGRAEGLLLAFAARRAIDRGLALGYVEGQLRQRFAKSHAKAVAIIVQSAQQPVTVEDLRLGLDTIAPELTSGAATDGWWASFRREIASLIVIRHEGTPSPRAADRLARARRLLDAGQVEAALVEVGRLPGAAGAAAWISAAGRYVEVHQALDEIEAAAIQVDGGSSPVPLPPVPAAVPAPVVPPSGASPTAETTATGALAPKS